jgi:hypothetical protein
MLRGREDGQHGGPLTAAIPPSLAEDALAVLMQHLEITAFAKDGFIWWTRSSCR